MEWPHLLWASVSWEKWTQPIMQVAFVNFQDSSNMSFTPVHDLLRASYEATSESKKGWILLLSQSFLTARLIWVHSSPIPIPPGEQLGSSPVAVSGNQAANLRRWPESSLSAPKNHESGLLLFAKCCNPFAFGAIVTWRVFQGLQLEQKSPPGKTSPCTSPTLTLPAAVQGPPAAKQPVPRRSAVTATQGTDIRLTLIAGSQEYFI